MIKFTNTHVTGMDTAIRSMRMPLQSFNKSDSHWDGFFNEYVDEYPFTIGPNDLDLAHRLLSNNDADSKFLRSIQVYTEITAPMYFLAEFDTYKIGTVRNSSSLQHTGAKRDYHINDFSIDDLQFTNDSEYEIVRDTWGHVLDTINFLRKKYKETNDYRYFRLMRQLMPSGYEYFISWTANYQVLRTMYFQRVVHKHRLTEWSEDFKEFVESLPYARDLITYQPNNKEEQSNG